MYFLPLKKDAGMTKLRGGLNKRPTCVHDAKKTAKLSIPATQKNYRPARKRNEDKAYRQRAGTRTRQPPFTPPQKTILQKSWVKRLE